MPWPLSNLDNDSEPVGVYASAKREIEWATKTLNRSQGSAKACCLRYGGVLACNIPTSNGTTEQLDKLIIAAAEHFVLRETGKPTTPYIPAIPFSKEDPSFLRFTMVDARTVGKETFRYLHNIGNEKTAGKEAVYFMADYSATLWDTYAILKKLAPSFKMKNDPGSHDEVKKSFASQWPKFVQIEPSIKDWGFNSAYTLEQSVAYKFQELVQYFRGIHNSQRTGLPQALGIMH